MVLISNRHNKPTGVRDATDTTFLSYVSLIDRECYDYYRSHRRRQSKNIDQYNYFVKAVNGIFSIISHIIAQSEGGVYIKGLGYFCCIRHKRKKTSNSLTLRGRTVDSYRPYFFPDEEFKDWTMHKTFCKTLRMYISEFKEVKHTLHFDVCDAHRKEKEEATKFNSNRYRKK